MKATLAEMRGAAQGGAALGDQDLRLHLQEPRRPPGRGPQRGRAAGRGGCRGLTVGGARFSEKHANFVENMGDATTADVIALMAEGRRRVRERFGVELEPEVQLLGRRRRAGALGVVTGAIAAVRLRLAALGPRPLTPSPRLRRRAVALAGGDPGARRLLHAVAARLLAGGGEGGDGDRAHRRGGGEARAALERAAEGQHHPARRPRRDRRGRPRASPWSSRW